MKLLAASFVLVLCGLCATQAAARTYEYDIVGSGGAVLGTIAYDPSENQSSAACEAAFNFNLSCLGISLTINGQPAITIFPSNAFQGILPTSPQGPGVGYFVPPTGFDHVVNLDYYIGDDTNVANALLWAVKTPGAWFDPASLFPAGEGDPIVYAVTLGGIQVGDQLVAVVPQPPTMTLTLLGFAGLAFAGLRGRSRAVMRA